MSLRRNAVRGLLAVAFAAVAAAAAPAVSHADVAPKTCTDTIGYNANIPTWEQWFAAHPDPNAALPFGAGTTGAGGGAPHDGAGTPATGRNLTAVLYEYWDGLVAVTASDAKDADGNWVYPYQVIKKIVGTSANGRPINFYVVSTREHIANLDAGSNDAAFWRGVREGTIPTQDGLDAAGTRPAFAWATATPHGDESAAGESITRELYEELSRTDCENWQRMNALDMFLMPIRNPDGHDAITRTTAWGFDPNRDFGTQNQVENGQFVPLMNEYPGVFFIDAHQQGGRAYFFPPNEDPVHHEISDFSINFIQNIIGPAIQNAFNDQTDFYQNYNEYDLFTPEYGDTVPSLLMGAAGMTYEKGNGNIYSRQIYDHYLAIDTTINTTAASKVSILDGWIQQWGQAVQQGQDCIPQPNKLVSPLHDTFTQIPDSQRLCGFFFKPNQHVGDTAAMIALLQKTGVRVWKLDTPVAVNGYQEYGGTAQDDVTLPAGTLWIPLAQGTKHWIEALLEENPFIPYNYYYDVVTWSYPLQRGLAGSGYLIKQMPAGVQMTEVHSPTFGAVPSTPSAVYAFNTDSMQGIGLAADLLAKGVNVYRGQAAFDANGTHFYTGAALVDGASLTASGADLATLAGARNTPVTGLANYPVAHFQLTAPKIGLYTGSATIPTNPDPRYKTGGAGISGTDGHCGLAGGGSFCEALFTLTVKDKIASSVVTPITSGDLASGRLVNEHFTAFIDSSAITTYTSTAGTGQDPCSAFTANAAGQALQAFVNAGGTYIGNGSGGYTTARCVLTPAAPITTISGLLTPGSTFDATFDTTDPLAWGFDLGGWIYRDSSGNPTLNPATLGAGKAVEKYAPSVATNPSRYGYQTNAMGLANNAAAVDTPYGSGHVVTLGYDAFYRAWKEEDERLVLNGVLLPVGAAIPASEPSPETAVAAPSLTDVKPAEAALPASKLTQQAAATPAVTGTTLSANADRDVRIAVRRADGAKLRAAVKAAKLSRSLTRKVRYVTTKQSVTLVVKGERTSDQHARQQWVSRIQKGLAKARVKPLYGIV